MILIDNYEVDANALGEIDLNDPPEKVSLLGCRVEIWPKVMRIDGVFIPVATWDAMLALCHEKRMRMELIGGIFEMRGASLRL